MGTIFDDVLTPYERAPRLPLPAWAHSVRERFALLRSRNMLSADLRKTIQCYNEAALIEAHRGRRQHSELICQAALKLLAMRVERADFIRHLDSALQPYINLGRLDRIKGEWGKALEKFSFVKRLLKGERTTLGAICLEPTEIIEVFARQPEIHASLRQQYLIDSIKTLFRAGEWSEIINLTSAEIQYSTAYEKAFLREAYIVALCHMSRFDEAKRFTCLYLTYRDCLFPLVLEYRYIEVSLLSGNTERATNVARKLSRMFLSHQKVLNQSQLTLLSQIGRLLLLMGDEVPLEPLANLGLTNARQADDVVLQSDFHMLLSRCANDSSERARADHAATEVKINGGYYAPSTEAGCAELVDTAHFDELCRDLLEFANDTIFDRRDIPNSSRPSYIDAANAFAKTQ